MPKPEGCVGKWVKANWAGATGRAASTVSLPHLTAKKSWLWREHHYPVSVCVRGQKVTQLTKGHACTSQEEGVSKRAHKPTGLSSHSAKGQPGAVFST